MPYKHLATMKNFLNLMEWTDELEFRSDLDRVRLSVGISVTGQAGRAIIDARNDDVFEFYIYYNFMKVNLNKIEQMKILLSEINMRIYEGCFELVGSIEDSRVRWRHIVDFEEASPTGLTVLRNFRPGWNHAERWLGVITAVAVTAQSAADALSEAIDQLEYQKD